MSASFPNGLVAGVAVNGLPLTISNPGEIFWVNSTSVLPKFGVAGQTRTSATPGKGTYNRPFLTINQALDSCTANRGDIIMVMPGYTETNAATGSTGTLIDVAGVAVIGLGAGDLKPTITHTHASADINITSANNLIYNFRFVSGVADHVNTLDITGANCHIDSCEFMCSAATTGSLSSITSSATASFLKVTNCDINMESSILGVAVTDVAENAIQFLSDGTVIQNCNILGDFSVAALQNLTTATIGVVINDNNVYNISATAAAGALSTTAGCTGMFMRNHLCSLETSTIDGLVLNTSIGPCRNFAVNVLTETSGVIHAPAT